MNCWSGSTSKKESIRKRATLWALLWRRWWQQWKICQPVSGLAAAAQGVGFDVYLSTCSMSASCMRYKISRSLTLVLQQTATLFFNEYGTQIGLYLFLLTVQFILYNRIGHFSLWSFFSCLLKRNNLIPCLCSTVLQFRKEKVSITTCVANIYKVIAVALLWGWHELMKINRPTVHKYMALQQDSCL